MYYYESIYRGIIRAFKQILAERERIERDLFGQVKPQVEVEQLGFAEFHMSVFKSPHTEAQEIAKKLDEYNLEILKKAYRVVFCGEKPEPVETKSLSNYDDDVELLIKYFSAFRLDLPNRIRIDRNVMAHKHFFGGRGGLGLKSVEKILDNRNWIAEQIRDDEIRERFLGLCRATEKFIAYGISGEKRLVEEARLRLDEANKKVFDELSRVAGIDLVVKYLLEVKRMPYYRTSDELTIDIIKYLLEKRRELEIKLAMEVKPKPQFGFVEYVIEVYEPDENVQEIVRELDRHNLEVLRKAYQVIFRGEEPEPVKTISLNNESDAECLVRYFSVFKLNLPKRIYVDYGVMAHKRFFTVGKKKFDIYAVEEILQNQKYVLGHIANDEIRERFLRLCRAAGKFVKYRMSGEERVIREVCKKIDEINRKVFEELSEIAGVDLVMEYLLEVKQCTIMKVLTDTRLKPSSSF